MCASALPYTSEVVPLPTVALGSALGPRRPVAWRDSSERDARRGAKPRLELAAFVLGALAALGNGCANVEPPSLPQAVHVPNEGPRPPVPEAKSLDALLVATVHEWAEAHDTHDRKRLEALYASHVRYERFELSQEVLLRVKEAGFARSPSARRTVADVRIDRGVPGLPVARFRTTHYAMNRIRTEETRLVLSCDTRAARDCEGVPCAKSDAPSCVVVDEEDASFLTALARGSALATRPGSCPEAIVAFAASTKDAQAILGDRPALSAAVPLAMPPESPLYAVVFVDPKGTPKALYELDPLTLDMTEVLPGDLVQPGDSAKKERAKRACTPR